MTSVNERFRSRTLLCWVVLLLSSSLFGGLPYAVAQITAPASSIETQPRHIHIRDRVKEGGTLKTRNTFRADVDLVLVPVTVTDERNHPVTNLEKQNFVISEGDKEQPILFFSTEDAPISIALVVDLSGSMGNKIDEVHAALSDFFANANPEDDYYVVTVSDKPSVLADSTQSIGTIQERLASDPPGGYTALLDAVYLAETKLRSARYKRKAVLIISDGGDNASRYTLGEITNLVEESDAQVYAIGLFDGGIPVFRSIEEKFGKHLLTKVTDAGGGRTLSVSNLSRLPAAAATVSKELRSQYVLGYKPSRAPMDSNWRKIKVTVMPARSKLQAYYKKGYMAGVP